MKGDPLIQENDANREREFSARTPNRSKYSLNDETAASFNL